MDVSVQLSWLGPTWLISVLQCFLNHPRIEIRKITFFRGARVFGEVALSVHHVVLSFAFLALPLVALERFVNVARVPALLSIYLPW